MLAYVLKLIDRAQAQGNQPPRCCSGAAIHPRRPEAPGRQLRRPRPSRATFARARARRSPATRPKGRRVVLATASYRLYADGDRRAAGLRRRHRHRLDHRPRRARPREDRRRELLRRRQAADDRATGSRHQGLKPRPRPLLFRSCQRRAGVRMGGRAGRGEPARPAAAAGPPSAAGQIEDWG